MKVSTDDGQTWVEMNRVRIMYEDIDSPDGESTSLQISMTNEGLICDMVGDQTGEVLDTYCTSIDDLRPT